METKRTKEKVASEILEYWPRMLGGHFRAEPTAEAARGRHPGFSSFNVVAAGPGSLSLSFGENVWSQTMQTIPVFGCFFVMCVTPLGAADETDSDKLARKAYLTFCQAYNKNELDGVMKVMDVPWLELGKPVVKDRIELQKIWKKLLADRSVESLPWTKFKVEPMSVLREAAKGNKDFLTKLERLGLTRRIARWLMGS